MRGRLFATALLGLSVSACAVAPVPIRSTQVTATTIARPAGPTPAMQYLYGSGEAAAQTVETWRGLVSYVADRVRARPTDSVVLAPGATLVAPAYLPCGDKPLAAVFDVDETVLLNFGEEAYEAAHPGPFDAKRWSEWERTGAAAVAPTPGAAKALTALRAMGVTVVFNTNRSAGNAAGSEAAINGAGIGPAVHGETLFLAGDDPTGGHKDGRRAAIASRFCVVAMAGDQLGDFSDLFNAPDLGVVARRRAVLSAPISTKWGAGWFMMPNPVYGPGMKGSLDEVFPLDKRWAPGAQGRTD